jgi:RimJ/RimL family protein N-acetyltransferase
MPLHPTYPLETERLRLRPFTRGDVDAVFDYRGREDVARYLFDPPLSRDECALAIQQRTTQLDLVEEGDRIILAVERQEDNRLVGEVSLIWRSREGRQGELGWIFHPAHQGRGYATEATQRLLDLGFGPADLHRVFARCDARNTGSWRLMERLGMRREAHFREHAVFKGGWDEEFYYALLRREWLAKRQGEVEQPAFR